MISKADVKNVTTHVVPYISQIRRDDDEPELFADAIEQAVEQFTIELVGAKKESVHQIGNLYYMEFVTTRFMNLVKQNDGAELEMEDDGFLLSIDDSLKLQLKQLLKDQVFVGMSARTAKSRSYIALFKYHFWQKLMMKDILGIAMLADLWCAPLLNQVLTRQDVYDYLVDRKCIPT